MMTGINDLISRKREIPETIDNVDSACKKYQHKFPNAIIHLGSVAPINEKCIQYNSYLQDLAAKRQVPFISTEGTFDEQSGKVKFGHLHGIHYTQKGIRPLAKQIKRSLYDRKFIPNFSNRISHPTQHQHLPIQHAETNHNHHHFQQKNFPIQHTETNRHQIHALKSFFDMAQRILSSQ